MELYEIAAESITEGRQLSRVEIARIIGAHSEWRLNQLGELVFDGDNVAESIEQAAAAMDELGWICEGSRANRFPAWELMPQRGSARADALRRALRG